MAEPNDTAQGQHIDPDIQKAQGYLRAFGITDIEIDGKKETVKVDGLNSRATSAALAKYRADNGFDNSDNFSTVLGHMEDRIQKNPPGIQQFMSDTMADGQQAGGFNVMAMQLIMNLLAPLIQTLSGGKINLDQLKIDGINGPKTSNAYNGYDAAMNGNAFKPNDPAAPVAAQAQAGNADPLGAFIAQQERTADQRFEAAIRRPSVEPGSRPALRVDGAQDVGADGSYIRASRAYAGDGERYQQRPSGYGEMRQQYYTASGAEVRDRMLQERAELRETGYAPRDVKNIVRDNRVQELEASGMGRRAALNQANAETRMVDNVERGFAREARAYDLQQDQRDLNRAIRAQQQADVHAERHARRDGMNLGRDISILSGADNRTARAVGSIVSVFGGAASRGASDLGFGGGMDRRTEQQMRRDGMALGRDSAILAGADNREARAIGGIASVLGARGIPGIQTGTPLTIHQAQPLPRGSYNGYERGASQGWSSNQIRPEFDGARSYGNAADPRMALAAVREQPIMVADQPQNLQERMADQRRMQEIYSPG